uniref:Anoctamin n=1 Tax=Panagrellus redivivus TaxID=6233 RepID=A0A7E4UM33_PANRE
MPWSDLQDGFKSRLVQLAPMLELFKLTETCPDIRTRCLHRPKVYNCVFITDKGLLYKAALDEMKVYNYLDMIISYASFYKWTRYIYDGPVTFDQKWDSAVYGDALNLTKPIYVRNTLILHCRNIEVYEALFSHGIPKSVLSPAGDIIGDGHRCPRESHRRVNLQNAGIADLHICDSDVRICGCDKESVNIQRAAKDFFAGLNTIFATTIAYGIGAALSPFVAQFIWLKSSPFSKDHKDVLQIECEYTAKLNWMIICGYNIVINFLLVVLHERLCPKSGEVPRGLRNITKAARIWVIAAVESFVFAVLIAIAMTAKASDPSKYDVSPQFGGIVRAWPLLRNLSEFWPDQARRGPLLTQNHLTL